MSKVSCITVNTDASFCRETKAGGYAFYIICDKFKIMKSGSFKRKPNNPNEAEIMSLGNAMATLYQQKELPKSDYIIVNCDAMSVGHLFEKPKKKSIGGWIIPKGVKGDAMKFVRMVQSKTHTKRDKIQFRHVKAHTNITDSRSWVNDWCDKEAKKWMRKQRQEFMLKANKLNH